MRYARVSLLVPLVCPFVAGARPLDPPTETLPFSRAGGDTLWFGGQGPNGAAVLGGIWDFDDGTMQGWTASSGYDAGPWFRHLTADSCSTHGNSECPVITANGSTGSMWVGAHEDEVLARCFPGGLGYSNYWKQGLAKSFTYGGGDVTLEFDYFTDSETGYDFTFVYLEGPDGSRTEPLNTSVFNQRPVFGYQGGEQDGSALGSPSAPASDSFVVPEGDNPADIGETMTVVFEFFSDPLYSDGLDFLEGYWDSRGGFGVDNVAVSGIGLSDFADFEPDGDPLDGWEPRGADLKHPTTAQVAALDDIDPLATSCDDELSGFVLLSVDPLADDPHPPHQHQFVRSNALFVGEGSGYDGSVPPLVRYSVAEDNATSDGINLIMAMDTYPWTCPETGAVGWSIVPAGNSWPIVENECRIIVSDVWQVPAGVDSIRVLIRVLEDCNDTTPCETPDSTPFPYFDNIQIGLVQPVVGMDDPAPPAQPALRLLPPPTPFRAGMTLAFEVDRASEVTLQVFDAAGARVATVWQGATAPGRQYIRWDGRGAGGRRLASGVYWLMLGADGEEFSSRRLVLVR